MPLLLQSLADFAPALQSLADFAPTLQSLSDFAPRAQYGWKWKQLDCYAIGPLAEPVPPRLERDALLQRYPYCRDCSRCGSHFQILEESSRRTPWVRSEPGGLLYRKGLARDADGLATVEGIEPPEEEYIPGPMMSVTDFVVPATPNEPESRMYVSDQGIQTTDLEEAHAKRFLTACEGEAGYRQSTFPPSGSIVWVVSGRGEFGLCCANVPGSLSKIEVWRGRIVSRGPPRSFKFGGVLVYLSDCEEVVVAELPRDGQNSCFHAGYCEPSSRCIPFACTGVGYWASDYCRCCYDVAAGGKHEGRIANTGKSREVPKQATYYCATSGDCEKGNGGYRRECCSTPPGRKLFNQGQALPACRRVLFLQ